MQPDTYTRQQVCERLQISLATLERLIRRGELPVVKVGRRVLIRRRTLEAFLRQREAVVPPSNGAGAEPPRAAGPDATRGPGVGAPEPDNQVLEARIRAMHADGLTKRQIANQLNKEGVPAGTVSGRWDVDTVLAWLATNAVYDPAAWQSPGAGQEGS
jgi:excisionase family DNA binding protein